MEPPKQDTVGARIRELRRERKVSASSLAQRARRTTDYLYAIERGDANPSHEMLRRIARVLKVKLADLITSQPTQ